MSLHLSPRVPRPKNSRHAQPLWTLARQSVAFLALIGLLVTTIPLVSARSRIRLVGNSASPDQGPSKARPTTSALLQGNSQNRGMPPLPVNPPGVTPGPQPTKQEREAKINKLDVNLYLPFLVCNGSGDSRTANLLGDHFTITLY